VFRLRFASSIAGARQMVCHGSVFVNDNKVDIPSFQVGVNDKITVKVDQEALKRIKESMEATKERGVPSWLTLQENELIGTVVRLPQRDDIQFPIKEQLIIELYSK